MKAARCCPQVVDEATHKAMLAWHFKKQEQQQARRPQLHVAGPAHLGGMHAASQLLISCSCTPSRRLPTAAAACAQKLAEDDGTAYYDSAWADPKALKTHFSGVSQVRLA